MMYTNSNNNYEISKQIRSIHKMDKTSPETILDLISLHEYHKFVLVKFYIKVGYPLTSQPNINAIIGPYGVNIMNLQKKLEPLNEIFKKDTTLPIMLKVYDFDKYHIILKTPTLRFFFDQIEGDSNFISIYLIYELVQKKKRFKFNKCSRKITLFYNYWVFKKWKSKYLFMKPIYYKYTSNNWNSFFFTLLTSYD